MTTKGFTFDDVPDQTGKTMLVTGANTGIGYHIAEGLARRGAHVVLMCRDEDKAEAAREKIAEAVPGAKTDFIALDLADMASVRSAAKEAAKLAKIDALINNAGVMMPPLSHATAGAELQFAVNHLGHFALAGLLLPKLAEDGGARIVVQSSIAHKGSDIDFDNLDGAKGYNKQTFYGQSKLANLLFALELDRRLRAANSPVASIACHPGVAATELTRHIRGGKIFSGIVGKLLNDAADGALPALQAATDPGAVGGDYYGSYGFMESRGPSGRAHATATARDPILAMRLWERSVEMTGVDPGLEPA